MWGFFIAQLFLAATLGGQPPAAVAPTLWARAASPEPVEVLVLLDQDRRVRGLAADRWREEAEAIRFFPELSVVHLRLPGSLLADLAWDPSVVAVSPVIPVQALRKEGKALMRVAEVQARGFQGQGVGIAVLDTGVDSGHPELAPGGSDPAAKTVKLFDAVDGDADPRDEEGHGTAVAGIAAGKSGGVAPRAWIVAVRVLNHKGEGTSAQIAAGLEAVLASVRRGNPYNIRVVNLSLGGYDEAWPPATGTCDAFDPVMAEIFRRLRDEGVLAVAAAGNGGCTRGVAWPACLSAVVAVGAVYDEELCFDPLPLPFGCLTTTASFGEGQCMRGGCSQDTKKDRIACYSDSGEKLALWAPSHCAKTTKKGGGYEDCFGGTSAAAPYVSGVAALLAEAFPYLLPEGLQRALEQSGRPRTDDRNGITRNRVDAAAALALVGQTCPPLEPPQQLEFEAPTFCGQQTVALSWRGPAGAVRFRVQTSLAPDFSDARSWSVPEPGVSLQHPGGPGGRLFVRVRGESACGAASPWATASIAYQPLCERVPRRRLTPPR